jgi:hypothetical protein
MAIYYLDSNGNLYRKGNTRFLSLKSPNLDKKLESVISIEDLLKKASLTRMKRTDFYRELSIRYKDIKEEWSRNGIKYRSGLNFRNIEDLDNLPVHISKYGDELIKVYHLGRVYFYDKGSAKLYKGRGRLMNINTHDFEKWTKFKSCAPVYNLDLNCIE